MKQKVRYFLAMIVFNVFNMFSLDMVYSQIPTNDLTFNILDNCNPNGFNNNVRVIKKNGNDIFIGGFFTTYNGLIANSLQKLRFDQTADTSFSIGSGFNAVVNAIDFQSDGKIIVGGDFTTYDGTNITRLIRLNPDGSNDLTFNTGLGFNGNVLAIAIQNDGKILVGGGFTSYDGLSVNRIIRLNPDGSPDISFNSGGSGFTSTTLGVSVRDIKIQSSGKIIVGGSFSMYNGLQRIGLVRINSNGSHDNTFSLHQSQSFVVNTIEIQGNDNILIGGGFTSYSSISRNGIAMLFPDGGLNQSFNPGSGFNGEVLHISDWVVCGSFTSYNNTSRNRIALLNPDGSIGNLFNSSSGFNSVVNAVLSEGGLIYAGGAFTTYNGSSVHRIVSLNSSNGTISQNFMLGTGLNASVASISIQNDNKIILGGSFTHFNSVSSKNIIRLNSNGTNDYNFNVGSGFTHSTSNSIINATAIQSDGKILVGGLFTNYNGYSRNNIIRLNTDGSIDNSFNVGVGFDNIVRSISIQSDGKIIVGGQFSSYNGFSSKYIARLNEDGSYDQTFIVGTGFAGTHTVDYVFNTAIQPDGKIIVGGDFSEYNGVQVKNIARLNIDGSIDNQFNHQGVGFNFGVRGKILVLPNDKILVGGVFTTFNGLTQNRIACLNPDGTLDNNFVVGSGFSGTNSSVNVMVLDNDGKIVVGGNFNSYNGITRNRIAKLHTDGTLDLNYAAGLAFNNTVFDIGVQSDGKFIIGGSFTSFEGTCRNRVTRLRNCIDNSGTAIVTACQSYTWINGITYTSNNNSATFTLTNSSGCDSLVTLNLTIANPAEPTGSASQSFCDGATVSDLLANGTQIQWYSSPTGGVALSSNEILSNNTTYYASQTINNCESEDRLEVTVTIDNPSAPTGFVNQTFCNSATISDLVANGTQIQWYSSATGGTALSSNTTLSNNTTYYASQTINNCESDTRLEVTVNIDAPATPTGFVNQTFCNSATISDLVANGTQIQWYSSATGGSALSSNTTLSNNTTYHASQTINNCESDTRLEVTVNIDAPATPTGSANQTFCNSATVSDLVANGNQIQWYSSATGGIALSSNEVLSNNTTYYASQTINNCESENRLAVNISLIQNPISTVTNSGNSLTADQSSANYLWLDCDNNFTPISGANQISFTPAQTGNYAVLVTLNGCEATSDCYYMEINSVGIKDVDFNDVDFNLYPNPNTGIFTFETTHLGRYIITNNLGQVIFHFEMSFEKKELQLPNLAKGVYYVLPKEGNNRPIKFIVN